MVTRSDLNRRTAIILVVLGLLQVAYHCAFWDRMEAALGQQQEWNRQARDQMETLQHMINQVRKLSGGRQ